MTLREGIQRLAGTWGKANFRTFDATVQTVDISNRTCVVNSLDSSIIGLTVRFMVEVSDGDMNVPQEDSTVCVAMTDFTEPYIVSSTWLSKKLIVVGNQSIDIKSDKQVYNDGKYGGWLIVKDPDDSLAGVLKRLNLLEEQMIKIKEIFSDPSFLTTVNEAGSGAPSSFQILLTTLFSGVPAAPVPPTPTPISFAGSTMVKTTEIQITNPNITHGNKFD